MCEETEITRPVTLWPEQVDKLEELRDIVNAEYAQVLNDIIHIMRLERRSEPRE